MPQSRPETRFVFVTGGVVSALGKGIAAASLGQLLVARGLSVTIQKFDPYINVDPGTMSPFQHGEVFVTEDGAETDLDLGHYGIEAPPADLTDWQLLVDGIESAVSPVRIGLVGKYTQLADAYLSVIEALNHAGAHHGGKVEVRWVDSERLTDEEAEHELAACDGVLVPGGFGVRGIEGKIQAAR